MKLYKTNTLFDKTTYIQALAKIGVKAEATADGVLIDMEAYKANYKAFSAPHIVTINHKWVKAL